MTKICTLTRAESDELRRLIDEAQTAANAVADWLDTLIAEWESEIDAKSDKWRETDAATDATARLDAARTIADEMRDAADPSLAIEDME